MSKKGFLNLIKLASQPLPKAEGKLPRGGGYSGKQTLKRTNADSKARLRGKSRSKTS